MSMGSNPVFPINLNNYSLAYVINLININKLRKNLHFKMIFNKKNMQIINFFKNLNLIHKYIIIKNNNIIYLNIYLYYYKNNTICSNFKIISKPSKKFLISYKSLRLLDKKTGDSVFILSTPKGILTHKDALKFKTTGLVVGFFSI